ncbi:hypothetical protein C3495_06235 [Clostridiaceae bacterium 14S0207]|nr:hypothetical protein C3495_06235 [Clostridiaceae bacterium 14S0207]
MNDNYDDPKNFKDLSTTQKKILLNWIDENLEKIKSFNTKHTSYGLKHLFEKSTNGFYIDNGTFKGAMLEANYKIQNTNEKNWVFNISNKSACFKNSK